MKVGSGLFVLVIIALSTIGHAAAGMDFNHLCQYVIYAHEIIENLKELR